MDLNKKIKIKNSSNGYYSIFTFNRDIELWQEQKYNDEAILVFSDDEKTGIENRQMIALLDELDSDEYELI